MRTIKEILASGEQIDKYNILLKDGTYVDGFLVQERIDKEHDNEGYNVYDMRTMRQSKSMARNMMLSCFMAH